MKRTVLILVLIFALLLLSGCGDTSDLKEYLPEPSAETTLATEAAPTETTAPTAATVPAEPPAAQNPAAAAGFEAVYADICRLLDAGSWDLEYAYANTGMMEVVNYHSTKEDRYTSISYALEDIDSDGTPEMIVLDAMGNTRILGIFALQNGQPVMTHEGWARSRLYRLSDGALYSEGSSGAAYSIFEAYGQCWFTYPKNEEQTEVGFYYAADGVYDPVGAQEITADEYNAKQVELAQMITPFCAYSFS